MPQFAAGELKTAVAPITVKPSGLSCEAEIFLGPDDLTKVATSGKKAFVSTGASQSVHLPIVMPPEGTYHVYIDVFAGELRFLAYQAIEDVVIAPVGVAEFVYISGMRQSFSTEATIWGPRSYLYYEVDIRNQGNAPGVCNVRFQESMWGGVAPPASPTSNTNWSSWYNMEFTYKTYNNSNYTGARTQPLTGLITAELAPGETKTFWDSVIERPYIFKDRVIGNPGELVVMRQ